MEHNEILEIQNRYVSYLHKKDEFAKAHPNLFVEEDKLRRTIFLAASTLQVSKVGFTIFLEYIPLHRYEAEVDLTAKHLIKLSKYFKYPFYMKSKMLYLFCDEEQAFFINLCGEINQYLENLNS
jgi:hypothetical protein